MIIVSFEAVMSRPTTSETSMSFIRKTRELITRTERVRHLSSEIQSHIRNTTFQRPETTRKGLSMTFVNVDQLNLTQEEIALEVKNPNNAMLTHLNIVNTLIRHVHHMCRNGVVRDEAKPLIDLLLDIEKALDSLKVDIIIYASIEEEDTTTAVSFSSAFNGLQNSFFNESLRAFGIASDTERAMESLYKFYKANEMSLAAVSS